MQGSSSIKIDGVEIRLIRLPLLEPFETSFGASDSRLIFLLCLQADGLKGWGEVVASEEPRYSYETVRTAFHVIRDFFGPALLTEPIRISMTSRNGSRHFVDTTWRKQGSNSRSWICWPR